MSQPGFAGKRRIIDVPGNGSAFLAILATTVVRRVVIDESSITAEGAANTLQFGLQYKIPNDGTPNGFTTIFTQVSGPSDIIGSASLPITLGNPIAQHAQGGEILGNGPDTPGAGVPPQPATTLIMIRSITATGTSIVVSEYN